MLLLASVALLILAKPNLVGFLVGLPLVIVGAGVRIWASGYISKCDALATDGPYSLMRNPLYFGSMLIAFGYCAMSGLPIAWAVIVPLFFATHGSAIMWEEKFLIGKFGQSFADYCNTVPRWFPKPPAKGTFGHGHVSWAQVKHNREHKQSLGTLVVVVIFAIKLYLIYRH